MRRFSLLAFIILLTFSLPALTASATTYKVDLDHSTVSFKIRHLFSQVHGNFREFEGTIQYDPAKPEDSKVEGKVKADSIDTNVPQRDKHLKSQDFFETVKYPELTFKSTKFTKTSDNAGQLEGLLNIHGVEKPVTFDVELHGEGKDPWGNVRAGFSANTKINRKDFGLTWNKTLETGGALVGDDVDITLDIEGLAEEAEKSAG